MDERIGKSIGRYEVVELLGKGGAAVVYRARDAALDRSVALKLILPEQQHTDRFLKRFQREAKSLAQLSHPAVVKILDYGEMEGKPYLVTEFLSGGTLAARMGKPWNVAEAAETLTPIAHALAYAHQRHIIHRDVKPSNILLNESGQPMLSDFGVAKLTDSDESQSLTGTGVMVGTPAYMAPEQIQGHPVDARTDVYALSVVFFEMITGRKPYLGATPIEVTVKHLNDPIPRARQMIRDLPAEVEQVLLKGMAKKPEDRYQDMTAFANALAKLAAGKKGRAPTASATGVQTQTGTPSGTAAAPNQEGVTQDQAQPDDGLTRDDQAAGTAPVSAQGQAARRGRRIAVIAAVVIVLLALLGAGAWNWQGEQAAKAVTATASALSSTAKASTAVAAAAVTATRPATPTLAVNLTATASAQVTEASTPEAASPTPAQETPAVVKTFDPNRLQASSLSKMIEINRLEKVSVITLDWTSDGQWIVVGGSKFITLINPTTMKADRLVSLGNLVPKALALSPDSQNAYVLIGSQIHIYSLSTRQEVTAYNIPNGANSLAISPDGTLLAIGTLDNKTVLVNAADGVIKRQLRSNYGGWAVAFSPDGSKVAAGTSQGVLMWEVQTGKFIPLAGEQNTLFNTVTFSNDGTKLAAGSDSSIVIWSLKDGTSKSVKVAPGKGFDSAGVNVLRFTPDDTLLVCGADDHSVSFWNTTTDSGAGMASTLTSHTSPVYGVAISPDGRFMASGANEGVVRLWGLP